MSIISAIQAINAINTAQYDVIPIYITKEGIWYTGEVLLEIENYKNTGQLLSNCKKLLLSIDSDEHALFNYPQGLFQKRILDKIDVAFPVTHGTYGEDGTLQGVLEMMNIPYVGCDVLSSALGMDKVVQKLLFQAAGLPVVNSTSFYSKEWMKARESVIGRIEQAFTYPVIVKPAALGSSIGVARTETTSQLEEAIDTVTGLSQRILIEEAVTPLKEINCAVLGDYEHVEVSVCEEPVGSVQMLSFADKYISGDSTKGMSGAKRKLPADIPQEMASSIQEMAKQAFLCLQCQGCVRVDFLVNTQSGIMYVNEVNTIPGSLSFYLWEASGKSFTKLTGELIELALKRNREKNRLIFSYESNILAGYRGAKGSKGLKK